MDKKLAHIEKIIDIQPIYNKKSEKMRNLSATVLGWQCMIRPNEFKLNDLVIYVEVGSILPKKPEFEFLAKYDYRIRTQRYFGGSYLSQGLILPLSILGKDVIPEEWKIGENVTKLLEITKFYTKTEQQEFAEEKRQIKMQKSKLKRLMMRYSWFRKLFLYTNQKKGFPYWVTKTDEEKIQNIPHILEQFKDKEVYVTEKIDYQSGTWTGKMIPKFKGIFSKLPFKKYQFVVCSRKFTNNNKNSLYWQIAKKYNLEQILKENPTLTIQGEQGNSKIQGNKYCIREPKMWVFNIIDHERNYHYDWEEMVEFCLKYNLQYVPFIEFNNKTVNKLSELGTTVEDFIKLSQGKSQLYDIPREGIVVRCTENGKKLLSFKVINPDFEIKYKL